MKLTYYIDFSGISIKVLLCLIFILFMALIFNEIIELNFCGLSDNTKRKISERAEIDSDLDSMIDKNSTINLDINPKLANKGISEKNKVPFLPVLEKRL